MQIFRQFGQEPDGTDVRQLPGYQQLTVATQKAVTEAYQNTYFANQSKGFKIASGIAFATAKAVMEQLKGDDLQGNAGVPVTSGGDDVGMAEEDSGEKQKVNVKDKESQEDKAPVPDKDKDYKWPGSPATPPGSPSPAGAGGIDPMDSGSIQKKNRSDKGFGPKAEAAIHPMVQAANNASHHAYYSRKPQDHAEAASLNRAAYEAGHGKEHLTTANRHSDMAQHLMRNEQEAKPMTEAEYKLFETAVTDSLKTAKKQGYSLSGEPKQSQLGMSFKMTHPSGHTLHVHTSQNGMGWSHTHKNGTRKSGDSPHSMSSHLHDIDEKYEGFNKLKGELAHKKGVSNPGALAAWIGKKKYGSKDFSTHKHMGEAEDAHGNQLTKADPNHPSYKAGVSYAKTLKRKTTAPVGDQGHKMTVRLSDNNLHTMVHAKAVAHSSDTDKQKHNLQDKLHMQRQFKAGAHAHLGLEKPKGLEEDNSKQIQTKNFEEKCDYCGKVHAVGPCPAMQESEWEAGPAYTGSTPDTPPDYECGGDWGEGPHPDAASLLKKNHGDKGMSEGEVEESSWGEPEEHEPGVTYDHEMREAEAKEVGGMKPLKTMRSHTAFGHHINHELGPVVGHTARHDNIPSPYAYSPTDQVHHWNGKHVFTRETKHKHYQTFEVPKSSKIHKNEEDATTEYIKRKHPDYKGPHHTESVDPTLQAAVDYLANRVNVRGIMEGAMPTPTLLSRDKWSNTLVESVPHPQSGQKTQDDSHKKTAYHKALTDHGYEYKHTDQGDYGKWHHYEHPIHGTARTFHHDSGHHAYHLRKHGDNMNWAEGKGRERIKHDLDGQQKRHEETPQRNLFDTGKN